MNIQIKNLSNAYLALDGLTTSYRNGISLWLFGYINLVFPRCKMG